MFALISVSGTRSASKDFRGLGFVGVNTGDSVKRKGEVAGDFRCTFIGTISFFASLSIFDSLVSLCTKPSLVCK
jgi:hypothetical protein